ncbi:Homocysteine S-methyltransferase, partial [Thamnocephalis sphaerospora]
MITSRQTVEAAGPFAEHLNRYGVCILDGAFGTEAVVCCDKNNNAMTATAPVEREKMCPPLQHPSVDLAVLDTATAGVDNDADPLWGCRLLLGPLERVRDIHLGHLHAGAMIITTGSYQVSDLTLARRAAWMANSAQPVPLIGIRSENDKDAQEYEAAVVELFARAICAADAARREYIVARSSVQTASELEPWIAISLGPIGAMLGGGREYTGDYAEIGATEAHMTAFHRRQLHAARTAALHHGLSRFMFAWETLPSLLEASAVATVLREVEAEIKPPSAEDAIANIAAPFYCWVSFNARDGMHTGSGEPVEVCVRALHQVRSVAAIGVNC